MAGEFNQLQFHVSQSKGHPIIESIRPVSFSLDFFIDYFEDKIKTDHKPCQIFIRYLLGKSVVLNLSPIFEV